ncbi:MAG: DNA binding protein, DksA/TraR [Parcubacteria group bacterium Gr01-1014_46]|nr:MAG: DNA binding protein, DksA/TraR [Parcubacteria group bacterium Gr01-1014_46]
MTIDTNYFKSLLAKEASDLESQLANLGRKNPDRAGDWETIRKANGLDKADDLEVADGIEEFENNNAVLGQLELKLVDVKEALAKIEAGTYGNCGVCGKEIEEDRLEANPSAKTCKLHM